MLVEYSSNNSGGNWWLKDEHWHALEAAGWKVEWFKDDLFYKNSESVKENGRWLRALAARAEKEFPSFKEGIAEWEQVTGQDSSVLGCSCCGPPHSFGAEDDKGHFEYYSPEAPSHGRRYGEDE